MKRLPLHLLFSLVMGLLLCTSILSAQSYSTSDIQGLLRQAPDTRLNASDIQDIEITSQYTDTETGITHVYVQQQFRGIPVVEGTMGLHFNATGELVHFTDHFVTNITEKVTTLQAGLTPEQALTTALAQLGMDADELSIKETTDRNEVVFNKGSYSLHDIPVRLVYEMDKEGVLNLAWEVRIYTTDEQHYWVMSMDAGTGRGLARQDLVVHCSFAGPDHQHGAACNTHQEHNENNWAVPASQSGLTAMTPPAANFYRVFDAPVEAPTFGERTMVGTGGDPNSSPLGWHNDGLLDYNITKGNNVYAYQDPGPGSTGIPAVGGLPGQQPLVFDFAADLSLTPANYRDAAITNLFYWNNLIHDVFYQYGFTEEAGNFQWNNFANGGEGMDAVLAEAQDGSGVNNANFLTLADGLPGRMQMFLWTSVPIIDGDFDNGVIAHEYGHGISTRLTGGPAATCLSGDEQGGEGWSDYFGMILTMQEETVPGVFATGRGMGTYVLGEGTDGEGIRPAKYSTDFAVNDYTYGDINNSEISAPHGVGFIWATMLWEMTAKFVDVYGFDTDITYGTGGNNMALELVVTGLKLQPCGPTFVEQRDAILAADQLLHGGAHQCLIWEAFAKRGLGFSANSGTNARGDEIEAFDMPPAYCLPTVTMTTETQALTANGDLMEVKIFVTNNSSSTISHVTVEEEMPAGTSLVSTSRPRQLQGSTVRFKNISIPANTTEEITIVLAVNTASTAQMLMSDDMEANPFNWTASPGVDQFVWSTENAFSGDYAWFAANPNNFGNQLLTWNEEINVQQGTHLRFAHSFNTEANFDGGVVEVSNDGGNTWTDMGPLFTQNGYNNLVAAADNPLINGFCFGGSSGGYIHSVADLSPFAGQTVQVRFRFASDVLTAAEGWYIDDVQVVNDPFLIYNTASFSMANGFVTGSSTDEVLVLGQAVQAAQSTNNNPQAINQRSADFTASLDLALSPNPANDFVNVAIGAQGDEPITLRVLTAQGKEISRLTQNMEGGQGRIELSVADWPAGMYLIQLVQGQAQETQKLMIK